MSGNGAGASAIIGPYDRSFLIGCKAMGARVLSYEQLMNNW